MQLFFPFFVGFPARSLISKERKQQKLEEKGQSNSLKCDIIEGMKIHFSYEMILMKNL